MFPADKMDENGPLSTKQELDLTRRAECSGKGVMAVFVMAVDYEYIKGKRLCSYRTHLHSRVFPSFHSTIISKSIVADLSWSQQIVRRFNNDDSIYRLR